MLVKLHRLSLTFCDRIRKIEIRMKNRNLIRIKFYQFFYRRFSNLVAKLKDCKMQLKEHARDIVAERERSKKL